MLYNSKVLSFYAKKKKKKKKEPRINMTLWK